MAIRYRSSAERRIGGVREKDIQEKPVPEPDGLTWFYWEGAQSGQLLVQRCESCGHFLHPPNVVCPRCLSESLIPTPVSGRGKIYAYTVARQAFDGAFVEDIPYVLALVELEEQANLRILTNIVGAQLDELASDVAVEVTFEDRRDYKLPQFRIAAQGA
jgi:hypothetical protein